jgi:tetratricopeptide (TPR) repeat protein
MDGAPAGSAASDRDTVDSAGVELTRTRPLCGRTPPADDPQRIGRYTVRRRLGVGGMSVVYEAFDERLARAVALKLMLVGDAGSDRERLRREAQALARLNHPNVVEVFEIGEHDDKPYVAMALIEGHALDRWLRLQPRSPAEIVEVFVQAGEGLAAAHAQGLVHRDFKPGNVLVGNDGRVRVVDFGLVRESGTVEPSSSIDRRSRERIAVEISGSSLPSAAWKELLTRTGAMMGTPAYMSPEQLGGLAAGPASDQFAFCVALFESLHDQHPFVFDGNWQQLPYNVLEGRMQRPRRTDRRVLPRLDEIVRRGLALRPEARWPAMDVLLQELRRGLDRRGPRRASIVVGVGGVALGLGLLHGTVQPPAPDHCEEGAATMRAVWSSEARDDLRQTWLGTGLPGAADTWTRVDARLQTYADDWWAIHRSACDGPSHVVSTATCLAHVAGGLQTQLQVMAEPDESLLHNAVEMVGQLSSLDRCRASLEAPPGEPAFDDPPWQKELELADARLWAGQHAEATRLVEALLARADREGSARLVAEAKLRQGYLHMYRSEIGEAAAAFEEAYLGAKPLGHDALAADAALALLRLFGERLYRPAEANRWSGHARAETERVGDPLLTVRYLNASGRALRSAGELEQALAQHQEALAQQRALPSAKPSEQAISHFHIGSTLGLLGRGAEGRVHLEEALRIQEQTLGPRHPHVAVTLTNLGVFLFYEGDYDEALATLEESLEIAEEAYPDSTAVGWITLLNICMIHVREHRLAEAAQVLRRYLDVYQRSREAVDIDPVHVEAISCEIAMYEGEHERALPRCERAVELQEAVLASGEAMSAEAMGIRPLVTLGNVLSRLGRLDEALAAHRRALELSQQAPHATRGHRLNIHQEDAVAAHQLARVLVMMGRDAEALPMFERARADYLEDMSAEHPQALALEVDIGTTLLALARGEEARSRLRAAVQLLEPRSGRGLVHALTALAVAELDGGQEAAAREHAERALTLTDALPTAAPELAARARFAWARALGSSRREQAQAVALARQAAQALAEQGEASRRELEEVRAWLAERGAA